jgi:hypothetical protein
MYDSPYGPLWRAPGATEFRASVMVERHGSRDESRGYYPAENLYTGPSFEDAHAAIRAYWAEVGDDHCHGEVWTRITGPIPDPAYVYPPPNGYVDYLTDLANPRFVVRGSADDDLPF